MIKYTQIIKAVNDKLEDKFPDIKIQAVDVMEKLTRPSFRVGVDDITASNFMGAFRDRTLKVRVYFFPTSAQKFMIEMLGVQESLEEIFIQDNILTLDDDTKIDIYDEAEIIELDGVLHFYMDVMIMEEYEDTDPDVDKMENLIIEQELE